MSPPDRLDALIDAWCDGVIRPEDEAELDRLVASDRDMARRVALAVDLHRQLRERFASSVVGTETAGARQTQTSRRTRRSARHRSSRRWRGPAVLLWSIGGVAAAAILVIGLLLGSATPEVWIEGDASIIRHDGSTGGNSIIAGALITGHRNAVLHFADGTRLTLGAGAEVSVLDGPGKTLRLGNGTLAAQVAPQPHDRPLRILSTRADIEVVGTTFTLSADREQTELQVQTGLVRFVAPGVDTLVAAGESRRAALRAANPAAATTNLIAVDAEWSYLLRSGDLRPGWNLPGFVDGGWGSGAAPLGYDLNEPDRPYRTRIGQGLRYGSVPLTSWFRREFAVADPTAIIALRVNLRRDDGAVLYLNGVELARDGMPEGRITPMTPALVNPTSHETRLHALHVPASFLRKGTNCLAAEVHQVHDASSDLLFELELIAELTGGSPPNPLGTAP